VDQDPELQAIERALAAYLLAYPLACDAADGISRWWFDSDADVNMDKLVEALAEMRRQGVVERLLAADGHVRYRRACDDETLQALMNACGGAHPN